MPNCMYVYICIYKCNIKLISKQQHVINQSINNYKYSGSGKDNYEETLKREREAQESIASEMLEMTQVFKENAKQQQEIMSRDLDKVCGAHLYKYTYSCIQTDFVYTSFSVMILYTLYILFLDKSFFKKKRIPIF